LGDAVNQTEWAVRKQIEAMGAQIFEVGLFKPEAAEVGKAVMIPRTWDCATLVRSIPWMRMQNADGRNIYIRPQGEHDLSLVDDLSAQALQRMKKEGFGPAVVVETSPGNFQAWLKHPERLPREVSTLAARRLSEKFGGDPGSADWRHFGRLCGFTNRKTKYESPAGLFPFVKLVEANGLVYAAATGFVSEVTSNYKNKMQERQSTARPNAAVGPRSSIKSIEDFRSDPRYGNDATREDLAYSVYALSHGVTVDEASRQLSVRDLSHKGADKRQRQYVERTVKKAASILNGRARE
jgi:hypothetical protein